VELAAQSWGGKWWLTSVLGGLRCVQGWCFLAFDMKEKVLLSTKQQYRNSKLSSKPLTNILIKFLYQKVRFRVNWTLVFTLFSTSVRFLESDLLTATATAAGT
jgi:hypothetical protein